MSRVFHKLAIGTIVSLFLFPFGLTFLPTGLNTKMILAVFGLIMYFLNCIQSRSIQVSKGLLGAIFISLLFSFFCFYSAEYNRTTDYAYATYFVTFFVWMASAYLVCQLIRNLHGESNLKLLTYYLTGVCTVQCILAQLIDRISLLKNGINKFVEQGQNFYEEIGRLYGIGASLDPAGIRFAVVLILIASVISFDNSVRKNTTVLFQLLLCYFIIAVLGNMIARTTTTGILLSMALSILGMQVFSLSLKSRYFKAYYMFGLFLIVTITVSIYFYHTNDIFYKNIKFAFEGFFNWMETGIWRTSSTDRLNAIMWIWPTDTKTWIIGSGLFSNYIYSTDIGYCRFILYCGIIGFSVFAFLQIYSAFVFISREKEYKLLFLFLIILSSVIWAKVSTDIFQFYALFYCLDSIKEHNTKDENSLLYS